MIGVRFPPIDAGSVGAGRFRSIGRPWPLKSIPANGETRSTGSFPIVIRAGQSCVFPGCPAGGSARSTSRTHGGRSSVGGRGSGMDGAPLGSPTRNIRSRACGTPQCEALRTSRRTS
jgi:hypothetical protein